jgi:hypothetical protein
MKSQDDYLKTALRLPRDLHKQIHQAAEQEGRSMNAEIVARLQASFDYESKTGKALNEVLARMAAIEEAIKEGGKK